MLPNGNDRAGQKKRPYRARLRTHLITLVLVAVLPTIAFATVVVALLSAQQHREVRLNLRGTVRALSAAVDERVQSLLNTLSVLAVSEDFEPSNMAGVYTRVQRAAHSQPSWQSFVLIDANGRTLFHSEHPLGYNPPSVAQDPFFLKTLATKKPVISNFHLGNVSHLPLVSVSVPVLQQGEVKYILLGSIRTADLSNLLNGQHLPDSWTAGILDDEYHLIARSRNQDQFIGSKASANLQERASTQTEAIFLGTTLDGVPSYGAFTHSKVTGWTTVLSLPQSALQEPVSAAFWLVVTGGFALLFTGMFLAWFFGRRLAASIVNLSAAAAALGRGEPVRLAASPVAEVNDVSIALVRASKERNLIEENLRQSNRQAQEAIALRDSFLSVASHELKTPVTSLQLQLQLMQRKIRDPRAPERTAELERPTSQMAVQIKRLMRLVDELLDVSRISSGRLQFYPEPVELRDFMSKLMAQYEGEQERTGSALTFEAAERIEGLWDPHRLDHIFTNVISNAFKYGNGQPIHVKLSADSEMARITVQDFGIGIPAEHHGRIFERFERAVAQNNYGGLGLGLWIVHRIVSALGGSITVQSEPGRGSLFTVILPRRPEVSQSLASLSP